MKDEGEKKKKIRKSVEKIGFIWTRIKKDKMGLER